MSVSSFLDKVVPMFQKYGAKYKFHIISFAIAQACLESGYGTSWQALNKNNILGIGPGIYYSSWDACVEGYYTDTVLGGMASARDATTLDAYYKAFCDSNYCPGTEAQYYSSVKSIISENNLTKYDSTNGQVVSGGTNTLEEFLKVAKQHSMDKSESFEDWTKGVLGISGYEPWCADFIRACAKSVGILGTTIPDSANAGGMISGVQSLGGTVRSATNYTPKPGDLFSLKNSGESSPHHVGIVYSVSGNSFTSCEGNHVINTLGKNTQGYLSGSSTYTLPWSKLYQFATPDWGSASGVSTSGGGGALYSTEYTRADAIIREVGFLDKDYNHTLVPSKMRLCVMNYTSFLADLWELYGYGGTSGDYDTSELTGNCKIVIDYLISKGLNSAAACGVAGNIFYESSFDPAAVGDGGSSYGICQWHDDFSAGLRRGSDMIAYVGSDWANNLSKQCEYLWYDLEHNYKSTLSHLQSVADTESGCRSAADYFVRNFEGCSNLEYQSGIRQDKAVEYFNKIKKSSSGGVYGTPNSGGWVWPAPGYGKGYITSYFGEGRSYEVHGGLDIGIPSGSKVLAAKGGTVYSCYGSCQHVSSGSNWCSCGGGYGNNVYIDHGDNYLSIYGHMRKIFVTNGQSLSAGQQIGESGSTGWSTGPHLHFEVRYNGTKINPLSLYDDGDIK